MAPGDVAHSRKPFVRTLDLLWRSARLTLTWPHLPAREPPGGICDQTHIDSHPLQACSTNATPFRAGHQPLTSSARFHRDRHIPVTPRRMPPARPTSSLPFGPRSATTSNRWEVALCSTACRSESASPQPQPYLPSIRVARKASHRPRGKIEPGQSSTLEWRRLGMVFVVAGRKRSMHGTDEQRVRSHLLLDGLLDGLCLGWRLLLGRGGRLRLNRHLRLHLLRPRCPRHRRRARRRRRRCRRRHPVDS